MRMQQLFVHSDGTQTHDLGWYFDKVLYIFVEGRATQSNTEQHNPNVEIKHTARIMPASTPTLAPASAEKIKYTSSHVLKCCRLHSAKSQLHRCTDGTVLTDDMKNVHTCATAFERCDRVAIPRENAAGGWTNPFAANERHSSSNTLK